MTVFTFKSVYVSIFLSSFASGMNCTKLYPLYAITFRRKATPTRKKKKKKNQQKTNKQQKTNNKRK